MLFSSPISAKSKFYFDLFCFAVVDERRAETSQWNILNNFPNFEFSNFNCVKSHRHNPTTFVVFVKLLFRNILSMYIYVVCVLCHDRKIDICYASRLLYAHPFLFFFSWALFCFHQTRKVYTENIERNDTYNFGAKRFRWIKAKRHRMRCSVCVFFYASTEKLYWRLEDAAASHMKICVYLHNKEICSRKEHCSTQIFMGSIRLNWDLKEQSISFCATNYMLLCMFVAPRQKYTFSLVPMSV